MVKGNDCKKGEDLWIHAEATKCEERSWTDADLSSDTLRKWRLGNTCLFQYLVLIYVFPVLAKAKIESAPAKPVNENNVQPLPSQRKLQRKRYLLVETQTQELHTSTCEQHCQDCFRWYSGDCSYLWLHASQTRHGTTANDGFRNGEMSKSVNQTSPHTHMSVSPPGWMRYPQMSFSTPTGVYQPFVCVGRNMSAKRDDFKTVHAPVAGMMHYIAGDACPANSLYTAVLVNNTCTERDYKNDLILCIVFYAVSTIIMTACPKTQRRAQEQISNYFRSDIQRMHLWK